MNARATEAVCKAGSAFGPNSPHPHLTARETSTSTHFTSNVKKAAAAGQTQGLRNYQVPPESIQRCAVVDIHKWQCSAWRVADRKQSTARAERKTEENRVPLTASRIHYYILHMPEYGIGQVGLALAWTGLATSTQLSSSNTRTSEREGEREKECVRVCLSWLQLRRSRQEKGRAKKKKSQTICKPLRIRRDCRSYR